LLADHPSILIITEDNGNGHDAAIARALPNAAQVADRWRLVESSNPGFRHSLSKNASEPNLDRKPRAFLSEIKATAV